MRLSFWRNLILGPSRLFGYNKKWLNSRENNGHYFSDLASLQVHSWFIFGIGSRVTDPEQDKAVTEIERLSEFLLDLQIVSILNVFPLINNGSISTFIIIIIIIFCVSLTFLIQIERVSMVHQFFWFNSIGLNVHVADDVLKKFLHGLTITSLLVKMLSVL